MKRYPAKGQTNRRLSLGFFFCLCKLVPCPDHDKAYVNFYCFILLLKHDAPFVERVAFWKKCTSTCILFLSCVQHLQEKWRKKNRCQRQKWKKFKKMLSSPIHKYVRFQRDWDGTFLNTVHKNLRATGKNSVWWSRQNCVTMKKNYWTVEREKTEYG